MSKALQGNPLPNSVIRYQLLDRRECCNRLLERLRANMSVMGAHRLGLVADQFHHDAFRNPSIFEQAHRGMPKRVKAKTI
jgi:hypothetical protein